MDDLLQEFIAETREMMESVSGQIVAWEADPTDRKRLDEIFRFVHTVKGSCGFLDLPRLGRLANAAEEALAAVRDGQRQPDKAFVSAVLSIVDRIGEIVEAIEAGAALGDSGEELLIAALDGKAAAHEPELVMQAPAASRAASRSVRLSVDLLDRMMSGMSDMVLARNELARRLRDVEADPKLEAALERLSLSVAEMRDTVTRTRMQKIDALFSAVPRMVRDTAAELDKLVSLTIEGSDVELDREMVELIRDPLTHIIRNAVDHGIETPEERQAAGKKSVGSLCICARQSGNRILIEIVDDGRGIDLGRLVAKAESTGVRSAVELAAMTPAQQLDLIFLPGLSSRDTVTAISGRGVGMDVVRANIEQTGGRVELTNRPGHGLTIVIQIPLTLSIISAIVVSAGSERFAIARQSIEEIVAVRGDQVRLGTLGDAAVATVRGRRLPLVSLARVLGIDAGEVATLAIVSTREGDYALGIDAVLDTEELVVKPGAPAVMRAGVYAGQTLPDNGIPMLLLDGAGIAAAAGLRFDQKESADETTDAPAAVATRDALLFDDLDGQRRAIVLAAIDRVDTVPAEAICWRAGRQRLAVDGAIIPVHAVAPVPEAGEVAVLCLADGAIELAYAIAEPIEIVALPAELVPGHGTADGVTMIGGQPIEVVNAFSLFAALDEPPAARPLCLLQPDADAWMRTFLQPALEAAGYRCAEQLLPGEHAVVTVAMDDARDVAPDALRLRRERTGGKAGTIYRYDRSGLIAAIASRIGSEAA